MRSCSAVHSKLIIVLIEMRGCINFISIVINEDEPTQGGIDVEVTIETNVFRDCLRDELVDVL